MAVEEGICGDVSSFLDRNPLNLSKPWCAAFFYDDWVMRVVMSEEGMATK